MAVAVAPDRAVGRDDAARLLEQAVRAGAAGRRRDRRSDPRPARPSARRPRRTRDRRRRRAGACRSHRAGSRNPFGRERGRTRAAGRGHPCCRPRGPLAFSFLRSRDRAAPRSAPRSTSTHGRALRQSRTASRVRLRFRALRAPRTRRGRGPFACRVAPRARGGGAGALLADRDGAEQRAPDLPRRLGHAHEQGLRDLLGASRQSVSANYKSIIDGYFTNVAADSGRSTNVYATSTEYSDGSGTAAYSTTFNGSIVDTQPFPASGCTNTNPATGSRSRSA